MKVELAIHTNKCLHRDRVNGPRNPYFFFMGLLEAVRLGAGFVGETPLAPFTAADFTGVALGLGGRGVVLGGAVLVGDGVDLAAGTIFLGPVDGARPPFTDPTTTGAAALPLEAGFAGGDFKVEADVFEGDEAGVAVVVVVVVAGVATIAAAAAAAALSSAFLLAS